MTLATLINICNLNPVFKESEDSLKITAINQVLNDLELDNLLDGTDASSFNFQVQKFTNLTYKQLNETLELKMTEEDILALFQYTINELSNEYPFDSAFQVSLITNNVNRPAKLNYQAKWVIPNIVTGEAVINRMGYKATAKMVITNPLTQLMQLGYLATYNKDLVQEVNQLMMLGYNCTYRKQDLSQSVVCGVNYSATYSIL